MKKKKFIIIFMALAAFWFFDYSVERFSGYAIEKYFDKKILVDVDSNEVEVVGNCLKLVSEIVSGNESYRYGVAVSEKIKSIEVGIKGLFMVIICFLFSRKYWI